ncbi:hypothetical protein LXL04_034905 [Taraxacum kok-saghyz]
MTSDAPTCVSPDAVIVIVVVYLGFDKPSDHGQLRDGETQTRASHRIYHGPKDYLALGVGNCEQCVSPDAVIVIVVVYLGFDKPSDHGQLRDGETQTRASHRIYHGPKDYLALGVGNCEFASKSKMFWYHFSRYNRLRFEEETQDNKT